MKIYAGRYNHEIEKYIGKHVWILARSWRWPLTGEYYIQPIKYDHGELTYHRVAVDIFTDRLVSDEDLTWEHTIPWSDVDIVRPLDILDDFEMQEHSIGSRDKYFGGES